ncbi:MAG: hypothetical protein K2I54_02355, partial [Muribaculaceae bacterium]|nr:hypothetical protein [Muribaculaceae bacterium]
KVLPLITSFSHMDFASLRRQTYADFPGGYFDGSGVHWMLADAIGSVELVIDGKGRVEQHTGYYPYGEPWREPVGQPYLFGGKERRRFASLGDSDFHARFLTTATALWQAPDVHAGSRPWISPFVFCSANPIRRIDPTGMDDVLRGSKTKTPPGIKLFDDEEEYKRNAALNAECVENDSNSSHSEPAKEERSLLEKAAIGTEALATPMSVQNQLIESASESATGLEGSAAVQKYLGKAGVAMLKGAQYLGWASVGLSALNSGAELHEYNQTGGTDPKVATKLIADIAVPVVGSKFGLYGIAGVAIYEIAEYASDGFGTDSIIENQKKKYEETNN